MEGSFDELNDISELVEVEGLKLPAANVSAVEANSAIQPKFTMYPNQCRLISCRHCLKHVEVQCVQFTNLSRISDEDSIPESQ